MKDIVNAADVETQVIEAFSFRHACKVFDPEQKISDQKFNTILEAGRLSPTSFGNEPFKFLMIQTQEMRELFREFFFLGGNPGAKRVHSPV